MNKKKKDNIKFRGGGYKVPEGGGREIVNKWTGPL